MAETQNDGLILFVDAETGAECFQVNMSSSDPVTEEPGSLVKDEASLDLAEAYTVEGDKYRCNQCTRFTTLCVEKMKRHVRKVHQGLNPYKCSMCDYSTYNSVIFQEHVWIHQGVKPYECAFCKYRTVSKKNLKKHEQIHSPNYRFKCKKCKYIARHSRALKCHVKEAHSQPAELKAEAQDTEKLECRFCSVSFNSHVALSNHLKCRKKCKTCQKVLCSALFKKHMSEHGVKEPRSKVKRYIFTCQICKWMGSSKPKILLHLIHHPNQDLSDCKVELSVLRQCGILPAV